MALSGLNKFRFVEYGINALFELRRVLTNGQSEVYKAVQGAHGGGSNLGVFAWSGERNVNAKIVCSLRLGVEDGSRNRSLCELAAPHLIGYPRHVDLVPHLLGAPEFLVARIGRGQAAVSSPLVPFCQWRCRLALLWFGLFERLA